MKDNIVGVITSVEDDSYQGKDFKKVTLGTGEVLKVKYGKEGYLKDKWPDLVVGVGVKFELGEYMGKPFVKDFKQIDLESQPVSHETVKEHMPPPTIPKPTPKPTGGYKADPDKTESIERQVAMKEIREAWVGGKLKDDDPLVLAWYNWCGDKSSAWR